MAHISRLVPPRDGIDEYLNVDAKVGGDSDCPNNRSDVEAVQGLLAIILNGNSGLRFPGPSATGTFDAATGYYVYDLQHRLQRQRSGTVVDGCVSPASGISYGSGAYIVLHMNSIGQARNRTAWAALLDRYRTRSAT